MIWSRESFIVLYSAYLMYREENGTIVDDMRKGTSVCTYFLNMWYVWLLVIHVNASCNLWCGSSEHSKHEISSSGRMKTIRVCSLNFVQTPIWICNNKSQNDNDTISGFIIVSLALECSLWYYWNYIYGYLLQDASILLVLGHIVNFIIYVVVLMLEFSKL